MGAKINAMEHLMLAGTSLRFHDNLESAMKLFPSNYLRLKEYPLGKCHPL